MAEKKEVLEKLTDEQMKLIPVVRDEWLNKFLSFQYDGDKAMKLIEYIYELSELKMPKVVECESPMDCQIAANLWPTEYKDAKERKKAMGKKKVEYVPFSFYGFSFDYGWCAFYDFFRRIGIVKHEKFEKYLTLIDCNIFLAIYLKDVAFISKPPLFMKRDAEGQLHSLEGPALRFEDGYGVYSIHGTRFKGDVFKAIFGPLGSDADKTEARDAAVESMPSLSDEQREAVRKGLEELAPKKGQCCEFLKHDGSCKFHNPKKHRCDTRLDPVPSRGQKE